MHYDYILLQQLEHEKKVHKVEMNYLKIVGDLNSKIGYAEGTLEGVLWWDIPEELKDKLKETLKRLKEK